MTLKKQVEYILKNQAATRNSDIALTIAVWQRFFPQRIVKSPKSGREFILIKDLYDLPREDNVKRIRAGFNARGKYWPTEAKIAKRRGIKEDEWREELGYPRRDETYNPTRKPSYTEHPKLI